MTTQQATATDAMDTPMVIAEGELERQLFQRPEASYILPESRAVIRRLVFQKLIQLAMSKGTVSYKQLAIEFGLPTQWPELPRAIAPILYDIYNWCETKGLPKLTVLVVRQGGTENGVPGPGFWTVYDPHHEFTRGEKRDLTGVLTDEVYTYFEGIV